MYRGTIIVEFFFFFLETMKARRQWARFSFRCTKAEKLHPQQLPNMLKEVLPAGGK